MINPAKQNKKDYVTGKDVVIDRGVPVYVWYLIAALLVIGLVFFLFGRPKPLTIETIVPSGAITFARLDGVQEHLTELRASGFWKGFSKVDVPKLLKHSDLETKAIEEYSAWRSRMTGIIDHPLFKQFLGREVAIAFYPPANNADPMDWSGYASGILLVTRTEVDAQVTELLATIWSQGSKEWTTEPIRYQKATITSVHFQKSNLTVYYTRLRDLLVVSMNRALVASAIDTADHKNMALVDDENFTAVAQSFYKSPDGVVYVNMDAARNFLDQRLAIIFGLKDGSAEKDETHEISSYERIEDFLRDLEGVRLNGFSMLSDNPLKAKLDIFLDTSKMDPDAIARYSCAPTENTALNLVPKDAVLYQWSNCFDFSAYYEKLKALAREDSAAPGEEPFAELEETWGFRIAEDVLPLLGREFGWFAKGVDVKGLFPVPNLVLFTTVKDETKASGILRKIVTTPITLVQDEEYKNVRIHFVSIPLFVSFKPSFAFVGGYLLISTSDELIKASIDALGDPEKSLRGRPDFKNLNDKTPRLENAVSFLDIGRVAEQSRSLVDWTQKWFLLKIKHADDEERAVRRKLEAVQTTVLRKEEELNEVRKKSTTLTAEAKALEAELNATVLSAEAKDSPEQAGTVAPDVSKSVVPTADDLKLKKSQAAAAGIEAAAIEREIKDLQADVPDLNDEISDFENQRKEAENFHYFVEEVAVPLLDGLQSLSGQLVRTTFKDKMIESEMFLDVK